MRAGLVQLNSTDDPERNLPDTLRAVGDAAESGAVLVATPEVTNCVSASRDRQAEVLSREADDPTLAALRDLASRRGIWCLIGSLALLPEEGDRFLNRSFLVAPDGSVAARYDKIHMFDVDISETETYRESAGFAPGSRAVLADMDGVGLGMTICYDIRFPALYRCLAKAGAAILSIPAAFSPETGAAHWETLVRARAIETGSFVLAPAQCGLHQAERGRERRTHGHGMAVDPWGRVLVDAGDRPGVHLVDLDLSLVEDVRSRLPSLRHDREFEAPDERG